MKTNQIIDNKQLMFYHVLPFIEEGKKMHIIKKTNKSLKKAWEETDHIKVNFHPKEELLNEASQDVNIAAMAVRAKKFLYSVMMIFFILLAIYTSPKTH